MREILTDSHVGNALKGLVQEAGVSPEPLKLLLRVIPVFPDKKIPFAPWTDARRIDRLLTRLRDIAVDVQKLNESLFVVPAAIESSWRTAEKRAAFLGRPLDWQKAMQRFPQLPRIFRELPSHLYSYANVLERLRRFHRLVYPRAVSPRRQALLNLVLLVGTSKETKNRWPDLGTLLDAAFQATGAESNYTADWLRIFHARMIGRIRSSAATKKTK